LYDIITDIVEQNAHEAIAKGKEGREEFIAWVNTTFPVGMNVKHLPAEDDAEKFIDAVFDRVKKAYELKISHEDPDRVKSLEQMIILQSVDEHWQEYLRNMDSLREGISLRAYGQRDPLIEYKREAFNLFGDLMDRIKNEISQNIFRTGSSMEALEGFWRSLNSMMVNNQSRQQASAMAAAKQAQGETPAGAPPGMDAPPPRPAAAPVKADGSKVGRNDPCPCGSGKKYKKCCGQYS
ncbi:MAG TPA: SEC-C metal-binding domain-containing protein, partial [Tichowtungia sp.]|nr:SEC-C metal-binding domain-containing protein [Tichowtungia sp.]